MTQTPTKAEELAARLESGWCPIESPADMGRAAAELRRLAAVEAELAGAKKALALVQQHHTTAWNRGHEAGMRASRDAVKQATDSVARDAWGNTQLTEALLAVEAERDALRAALTRVLDTHEREAKAYLTAQVASENFSRRSAKADEHAHFQAAMESSKAEKEARELLAAMKGTT